MNYLANAKYGGSNNNMGVEVDRRNMKRLVLSLSTLATFLGALVKNIRALGVEHYDWLATAGRTRDCLCCHVTRDTVTLFFPMAIQFFTL